MPKLTTKVSLAEKIALWCLCALPVAVPLAIGRMPFSPADSLSVGNIVVEFFLLSVLTSVSLIAWSVALLRHEIVFRVPPAKWLLLGFIGLASLSTLTALNRPTALFGESEQMLGLITILLCTSVYFLATQLVTGAARVRTMALASMIGGLGVAVIGTLQNFGIEPLLPPLDPQLEWIVSQGSSTIGNPDSTGTFLVVPLVICATLFLVEKRRSWRIFEGISFALIAYALFITLTRGAWIGAVVGVVALAASLTRSKVTIPKAFRGLTGVVLALVGVGIYQAGPGILKRFTELSQGASAGGGRLILWREALLVIARHPLLGVGPDSYRYGWFPIRLPEGMRLAGDAINNDPHNYPLLIAATLGIPAALTLVALLGTVLFRSGKIAQSSSQGPAHIVYTGWWAALVGFSVALFFTFNSIPAILTLWLALGILSAPSAQPLEAEQRLPRIVFPVALTAFGIAAIVVSALTLSSVYNLALAKSQQSLSRAQEAVRLAPWHYNARVEATFEKGLEAVLAVQGNDPRAPKLIDAADATMKALVAFNPYSPTGYSLQASFLQEMGSQLGDKVYLERAVAAASGGLKIQPTSIELATRKANTLVSLNRFNDAAKTMSTVWNLYPGDPAPGVLYADALIKAGRIAEAKRIVSELVTLFPGDAEVARVNAALESGQ